MDTCLPFSFRSAPYLFNRLSQAIHWILANNYGVQHLLHYLDDFLTAGAADSPVCYHNLNAMLSLCQNINAPVKTFKMEPLQLHSLAYTCTQLQWKQTL